MIDFTAEWCAVCRQLETETFPHPGVVRMAEAFVPIRVDATDAAAPRVRELQRRYGVVGLPTILFLTPDGTPLPDETLTEFVPPERLLARMRRVRRRIASSTDPTRQPSGPPRESPS
jgi:thiol:disulfide interchange protein DsbD